MPMPEFAKQRLPTNPAIRAAAGLEHNHQGLGVPAGQPHRDMMAIVSETTSNECIEARQLVRLVEITTETRPIGASTWTVPEASGNFCERGGRFGAHSSHENFTPIYYNRVLFVSFFNAGVRALDIRDPFNLKEIAYYIPPTTAKTDQRCVGGGRQGGEQRCKTAIQTNNVEVDDRGYIYTADRANTGMHILELTGAARRVANFGNVGTK
jgi:hypothetical protein